VEQNNALLSHESPVNDDCDEFDDDFVDGGFRLGLILLLLLLETSSMLILICYS
jgi:hypothetical protein